MKRIGLGLLVVLMLLFAANAIMAWRVQAQLSGKSAAIRAAGDPASIADLRPAPIPNDRNAAAQIELLEPFLKGWARDHMQFLDSDLGKAYSEREDAREAPTAEQAAAMRAILAKYPEIAAGLARAAACDRFASRGDFSVGPTLFLDQLIERQQRFRTVMRFAAWQGAVDAADGKSDAAVRQGIDMLRLARLQQGEPTITSQLMLIAVDGVAVRELAVALASGPVSPELHAALDQELARRNDLQPLVAALKTERAFGMDATEQMMAGGNAVLSRLTMWKVKSYFLEADGAYDVLLPLVGRPWWEVHGKMNSLPSNHVNTGSAQLVIPTVKATYEAANRRVALARSLRVLNALREFAEKNGREASGLAELSLPAEAMVDPFSGQPLIVKHADAGWTVYAVGKNEKDDGGELEKLDVGVGPPGVAKDADGGDAAAVEGDAVE